MKLFSARSDLPFLQDDARLFLPWIVFLMSFLASLAMAGTLSLDHLLDRWNQSITGTLTVQILPPDNGENAAAFAAQVTTALEIVRETENVVAAHLLTDEELQTLLQPWLGSSDLIKDLPVPRLIDVSVADDMAVDLEDLDGRLKKKVPTASLDNHRVWLSRLVSLAHSLEILASAILALIMSITALAVIYATRASLTTHRSIIEVLHLIGAHDDYIARQFAHRTMLLTLPGSALGCLLAAPAALGVGALAARLEAGLVSEIGFDAVDWILISLVPIAASLIAMATARLTVHRRLSKML